jgi:hypothetical protein
MYEQRIRTLENLYKSVENEIDTLQQRPNTDQDKLKTLTETKTRYLSELRELRRKQYDYDQYVKFEDDR